MTLREIVSAIRDSVEGWCNDRLWYWSAPLLVLLAYFGVRHLAFAQPI